jgi:hypothetical protein
MWHAWERREKCTRFWWESLKEPFRRPRHRWEDGIRMDLGEIGWKVMKWIQLAQNRGQSQATVNEVMNLQVLVPWI